MPESNTPRYASIPNAAEVLDVHHSTVRKWISEGRIRGYKFGERIIRVDLNDVEAMATPIATANRGASK